MLIGDRFKEFRQYLKLSQIVFSSNIGITQSAISQIEKNMISISSEILMNISKTYNLNINWLLLGEGDMFLSKNQESAAPGDVETIDAEEWRKKKNLEFMQKIKQINDTQKEIVYSHDEITEIPFSREFFDLPVSGDISAGYPIPIHDDHELRVIPVSRKLLSDPSGYFCFRVNGESMQPEIFHNDYVVVSKEFVPDELHGRIVAVRNDEGITLKRMIIDFTNHISLLVPVNTSFSPILLDESHSIIGVIKLIMRLYD